VGKHSSIKVEVVDGKDIWLPCMGCKNETKHLALVFVNEEGRISDDYDYRWNSCYYIVECQGCGAVSFLQQDTNSDDVEYGYDEDGQVIGEHSVTQKLYPQRVAGRDVLEDIHLLPYGVGKVYREAHDAFSAGLNVLAGMGIRAVVEAICLDRSARGDSLEDKINNLKEQNLVTVEGAEILHKLRFLGNKAAHEIKSHTAKELGIAFEVVEHLLLGVYLIPARSGQLPDRKKIIEGAATEYVEVEKLL
jgi:hypothetical protein